MSAVGTPVVPGAPSAKERSAQHQRKIKLARAGRRDLGVSRRLPRDSRKPRAATEQRRHVHRVIVDVLTPKGRARRTAPRSLGVATLTSATKRSCANAVSRNQSREVLAQHILFFRRECARPRAWARPARAAIRRTSTPRRPSPDLRRGSTAARAELRNRKPKRSRSGFRIRPTTQAAVAILGQQAAPHFESRIRSSSPIDRTLVGRAVVLAKERGLRRRQAVRTARQFLFLARERVRRETRQHEGHQILQPVLPRFFERPNLGNVRAV